MHTAINLIANNNNTIIILADKILTKRGFVFTIKILDVLISTKQTRLDCFQMIKQNCERVNANAVVLPWFPSYAIRHVTKEK